MNLTKYAGSTAIVEAIFTYNSVPLDMTQASPALADDLFENSFMPYAIRVANWAYDGMYCNCQDLAEAFLATWVYVKTTYRKVAPPLDVGTCVQIMTGAVPAGCGLITKPWPVLCGPARGNVRVGNTATLDGRCLFPNHTVCQIGVKYYDPTFNKITNGPREVVERNIVRGNPVTAPCFWFSTEAPKPRYLYARYANLPAPQFTDSYQEMDARVWVPSAEWKLSTARDSHHFRSPNLHKVDAALVAFEQQGADQLQRLKTAFDHWGRQDPKEALALNVNRVVSRLKAFLGTPYPNNVPMP
jgi:hypothetical protein